MFAVLQEMLHIADTKLARRYGDFFIKQIHKLEEVRRTRSTLEHSNNGVFCCFCSCVCPSNWTVHACSMK